VQLAVSVSASCTVVCTTLKQCVWVLRVGQWLRTSHTDDEGYKQIPDFLREFDLTHKYYSIICRWYYAAQAYCVTVIFLDFQCGNFCRQIAALLATSVCIQSLAKSPSLSCGHCTGWFKSVCPLVRTTVGSGSKVLVYTHTHIHPR
jgi:hypothetical protein